jgi:hypothetical protein
VSLTLSFTVPALLGRVWDSVVRHQALIALLVSAAWFFAGYADYKKGDQRGAFFWAGIGVFIVAGYSVGALLSRLWLDSALAAAGAALEIWHMTTWRRAGCISPDKDSGWWPKSR